MTRRLLPLLLALTVVSPGGADEDHETAMRLREQDQILPLEELLSRLDLGADARVLEIESEREHGRSVYEIEYVDGRGRIREIAVDAATGEVISQEE
jgi:uncharacterized membrane protein YkoI